MQLAAAVLALLLPTGLASAAGAGVSPAAGPGGSCFMEPKGKVNYKFAEGNVFPTDPKHPHGLRLTDNPAQCCALCQSLKNCSFFTYSAGGTAAKPTCYTSSHLGPGGCCFLKTAEGRFGEPGCANCTSGSTKKPPTPKWIEWPSEVPKGDDGGAPSPFERSPDLTGFTYWSGGANIVTGTGADTWYPSWSADGSLYATFTDGQATDSATKETIGSMSCGPCQSVANNGSNVTQGFARALPSKPSSPIESGVAGVVDVGTFHSSALPYQGRYPSGNLFFKGVWYYGTYALGELHGNAQYPCGNWCVQGPFIGFRHSLDKGKNWIEPRMEMARDFASYTKSDNLFGELGPVCAGQINATVPGSPSLYTCTGKWTGKVKFGAPHVVDLGQELEHCPDADGVKRAYMVGHGADKEYQPQSWMHGSQVYMSRTKTEVSVETMSDGQHWEYFAGYKSPGNTAVWKDDVADAAPLFTWENRTGVVTMTYMPALKKFIMCVSTCSWANGTKSTVGPFDTYFLESSVITGPFKMVSYLASFGPQSYFVNIASSMLDDKGGGFLSYSANFAYQGRNPLNSEYVWDLLPFRFNVKGEQLQLEL